MEAAFSRVLRTKNSRPVQTVHDVFYALGGHLGRNNDSLPSWQTFWYDLMSLRLLVKGARLAAQSLNF